ncbi:MAG: N-acetylmuramoyl-L-alanine amidase, partial [Saccharofermentanales bacterium]
MLSPTGNTGSSDSGASTISSKSSEDPSSSTDSVDPSSSGSMSGSGNSGNSGISISEAEPTLDPNLFRYIADDSANLRSEPSSQSKIIKQLVYGTRLRYVSESGAWTQVITLDEEHGYIFSDLLSEYEPDPLDNPVIEDRKLVKWPSEFSVSGFYDAMMETYKGRFTGEGYMPLKGVTVILDPGHGGRDSGAVYTSSSGKSVLEKKINYEIALKTAADLEMMGAEVVLTRDGDQFLGLYARSAIVNLTVLNRHRQILVDSGSDTTETDRLIASMQSVINQNSDSESGTSRGMMKGLGACEDLRTVFDISAEHKDIIVVSLHCNSVAGASYVNGLEVYYGTNAKIFSTETKLLPNELKTNPLNPSYQAYDDAARLRLASVIRDNLKRETE